jgi:prepilin-type N-terminal cleavage/methylation domain-containing protein
MNNVKQGGFTLVELLISTTILSMLMLLGTYSYSLFTNKWQEELGQFSQANERSMNFQRLQTVLESVMPYVVRKDNRQPGFFFVGGENVILAITQQGLFTADAPEVFRLSVLRNDNGKYKLLYQGKPLNNSIITSSSQELTFSKKILLADNMDEIQFKYYGWNHFTTKSDRTEESASFQRDFSGLDNQLMPEKIIVFITENEKEIELIINLSEENSSWLSTYFDDRYYE